MTEPEPLVDNGLDVDVGTFDAFYHAARAGTLAVVLALRGPRVEAEEVVQEAFLRAFRNWGEVAPMDRPDLWVHEVVLNLATSKLRRLAAESRALTRLAGRRPLTLPAMEPSSDRFWRLVRQLPRRQGQALALRYAADLPVADVAAVLGCAEGIAKSHLYAARRTIAELPTRAGHDQHRATVHAGRRRAATAGRGAC